MSHMFSSYKLKTSKRPSNVSLTFTHHKENVQRNRMEGKIYNGTPRWRERDKGYHDEIELGSRRKSQ